MKISLIMLTKNSKQNLAITLASLYNQSYENWELIVQDCLSEDGTDEFFSNNCDRRVHFLSQQDAGLYDGLNQAIKRIKGDIVGVLHSDDKLYDDEVLADVVKAFEDPCSDVVYGNVEFVNNLGDVKPVRKWRGGLFSHRKLRYGWMPPHTSTFIKAHIFKKVGEYCTSYKVAGDYDLLIRIMKYQGAALWYLDRTICQMKLGGLSTKKSVIQIIHILLEDYRVVSTNQIGGIGTVFCKRLRKLHQLI